jgi:hypothetical protein
VLIQFHQDSPFSDSVPLFQDPKNVSKVLWLDEIQQAINEANVDENRAKQCKSSPLTFCLSNLPGFFFFLNVGTNLKSFTGISGEI